MFYSISIFLLLAEIVLLCWYFYNKKHQKKKQDKVLYAAFVFIISLAVQLVPFGYQVIQPNYDGNYILEILDCIVNAVKMFIGDIKIERAVDLAKDVPIFAVTYLFGVLLALHVTIRTAYEAFRYTIGNYFRVHKAMNRKSCDIVVGNNERSLAYAINNGAVLLLPPDMVDRDTAVNLMKDGYTVLRKEMSAKLFDSNLFDLDKEYFILYLNEFGYGMEMVNPLLTIAKELKEKNRWNISIRVEVKSENIEKVCREIILRMGAQAHLDCFRIDELLARNFAQDYPITRHMPKEFIAEDASIRPEKKLNVVFLGFGKNSKEVFRQSVLSNQFVCYKDNTYQGLPVTYYLYDENEIDLNQDIFFVNTKLKSLDQRDYFPIPDPLFVLGEIGKKPTYHSTLYDIAKLIEKCDSYTQVIIDLGDSYTNIVIAERLKTFLSKDSKYNLFVRSDIELEKEIFDENTFYYSENAMLMHNRIVDDVSSKLSIAIHQYYTGLTWGQAIEEWKKLSYFQKASNHNAAMSLFVKLNLLGLDFVVGDNSQNMELLNKHYSLEEEPYCYDNYFKRSVKNALIAQEHQRWNAYHLLSEYMPLPKAAIKPVSVHEDGRVGFRTKDPQKLLHACLTTFKGLDDYNRHLLYLAMKETGKDADYRTYEVYQYDDMIIRTAIDLLNDMGYALIEK